MIDSFLFRLLVASNYCQQQQHQQLDNTHAPKTITDLKSYVRDILSKYTTMLIPTQHQQEAQVQAPSRAHGMTVVLDKRAIEKRPERGSKGTVQFRYFATSVIIALIHYIISTKES